MKNKGIVVIGAGQAGFSVCSELRSKGFDGELTLIGNESEPPYQRPPLSKDYLLGETDRERLYLRPPSFFEDNRIALRLGFPAIAIDRSNQTVLVQDETVPYDTLVLATGSRPRQLPENAGGKLDGIYSIRNFADIDRVRVHFAAGRRVLIVGGGYIGLEIAAVARKLGVEVWLIEAGSRILQRVAAEETSAYLRKLHTEQGVHVEEGVTLERLAGEDGHVREALLADGRRIPIDFAVLGIGIEPETSLAEAGGLKLDNGIKTDSYGRTSDPIIWAVGDCASFPHDGGAARLESVGHAIDHGELVAGNILGEKQPYDPSPWFWSDQYETRLQIAGLNTGYDNIVERHGANGSVSHWYFLGDELLAVDALNDARSYMVGRRLIEAGLSPDKAMIADPDVDLKSLLKRKAG